MLRSQLLARQPKALSFAMPECPGSTAPDSWKNRHALGRLALFVLALALGTRTHAGATEPAHWEAPILIASLEPRLRQPSPEDYAQYEFLPRLAPREPIELIPPPEDSFRLFADRHPITIELPPEDDRERAAEYPRFATSALDANDQRSVVGGRLLTTRAWRETGRVHTEARLLWLCEFIQSEAAPTSFFAPGDSNIFVTQGMRYGSNWALLGGRVSWDLAGGLKAFAAYDAQVNSLEIFHIGSTGLGYTW